jgi:hypothetical protein
MLNGFVMVNYRSNVSLVMLDLLLAQLSFQCGTVLPAIHVQIECSFDWLFMIVTQDLIGLLMVTSLRQSESSAYHTVQVLGALTRQGAEIFNGNFQNFTNWYVKFSEGFMVEHKCMNDMFYSKKFACITVISCRLPRGYTIFFPKKLGRAGYLNYI